MMRKAELLAVISMSLFFAPLWAQEKTPASKICRVKLVSEVEPEMTSGSGSQKDSLFQVLFLPLTSRTNEQ